MSKYFEIKDSNQIRLGEDLSCEMAVVEVNGKIVDMGNYWDFHNGCTGKWDLPDYNSRHGLVRVIKKIIEESGKEFDFEEFDWSYNEWCKNK